MEARPNNRNHYYSQDFWPISNATGPKTELSSPKREFCLAPVGGSRPTWLSSPTRRQSESHVHLTALQRPSASLPAPRREPVVFKTPALEEASQPGIVAIGAGSPSSLLWLPLRPLHCHQQCTLWECSCPVQGFRARRPQYTQAG